MLKYLKKTQFFWDFVGFVYKFTPKSLFRKVPKELIIELSNGCNLRCPVCPTHFAMKREKGLMEFSLFKNLIDELVKAKEKPQLSFDFAGEPLVHPNADKFIAYANKKGFHTYISTNCTLLTEKYSKKLIEAGLSAIHLSIDGLTKKSHEAYRVGSKFEEVKKNIENFIKIRKQLKSKTPFISIQTLLSSFSEYEMNDIVKWAKKIGADEVNFKSLSMGSYTSKEMKKKYNYLVPTQKKFRRKVSKVRKTVCLSPLNQSIIYWNGNLGICCIDFDNMVKLPNIKNKGFIKTLKSNAVINLRKLAVNKKLKICKNCSIGNADYFGINVNLK